MNFWSATSWKIGKLSFCLLIVIVQGCSSPSISINRGFQQGTEYPRNFRVVASQVGPPAIQSHIADTLSSVLLAKGLTKHEQAEVVFSLHWSSEDKGCNTPEISNDPACVTRGQDVIYGHLRLDARDTRTESLIWQVDFRGIRNVPREPPTSDEIYNRFAKVFFEALADYPGSPADIRK